MKRQDKVSQNVRPGVNYKDIIGVLISGFFVWFTVHKSGLQLKDIKLEDEQWLYFAGSMLVLTFSFWVYAWRTALIWENDQTGRRDVKTFDSYMIGCIYNSILPGNLGEAARAYHLGRKNNIPLTYSLAGLISEKWLNALFFALMAGFFFVLTPLKKDVVSWSVGATVLVVVTAGLVYYIFHRWRALEKWFWSTILRLKLVGRLLFKLYRYTTDLLDKLYRPRFMIAYAGFSAAIFALHMLQFYLLLRAAGIAAPVTGLYAAYLTSLSMMIISFIPSAPSSVGVMHYGLYAVLMLTASLYNIVPDQQALQKYALFGFYAHLSFLLPEILVGAICVIKERKYLFELSK